MLNFNFTIFISTFTEFSRSCKTSKLFVSTNSLTLTNKNTKYEKGTPFGASYTYLLDTLEKLLESSIIILSNLVALKNKIRHSSERPRFINP